MNKSLLITGATGFTGKHIIDFAIKSNYKITALVRPKSNIEFLKSRNISTIKLDNELPKVLEEYLAHYGNPDLIIHNAGLVRGSNRTAMMDANVEMTKSFIEAIRLSGLAPQKFIFTSSIAAVGPADSLKQDSVTEKTFPAPLTHYGKSKIEAEKIVWMQKDIPWIIVRPTAIYGPGDRDMLSIYKLAAKGLNFKLTPSQQWLSFIFVEDFARALFTLAESDKTFKIYNLSDGSNYTSDEYMNLISKALNKKLLNIKIPKNLAHLIATLSEWQAALKQKPSILSRDKLHELTALNWKVSSQLIESEIGFKASIKLEEGIIKTLAWYKENGWI